MIHSARPTVSPVANIVFAWNWFCLARFWKVRTCWRTDRRTNGRHVQKQLSLPAVTVGWPSGSKRLKKTFITLYSRVWPCHISPTGNYYSKIQGKWKFLRISFGKKVLQSLFVYESLKERKYEAKYTYPVLAQCFYTNKGLFILLLLSDKF